MSALAERPDPDRLTRLDQLAEEIRAYHRGVEHQARQTVAEAVAAGDALLEAKALVRHGEWLPYVERCGVEPRLAQYYMAVARAKAKRCVFDAPSLRAALRALSKEREQRRALSDLGKPGCRRPGWWIEGEWVAAMIAQGRSFGDVYDRLDAYRALHAGRASLEALTA